MCISKGISCRPISQMQRTYTEVLHEIHPNVTTVFERFSVGFFFFFFFLNNIRFTSYKYVTFGYHKVHCPTYLIVISIDDLAPDEVINRQQIRIWYGILTWINQPTAIDLKRHVGENLLSAMHFIIFVTFRFFFSEIARLCSFIIDTFLFCK